MKASKFTEAQKAFILKQGEEGTPVAEICRKAGISQATYFNWKKRYGGLLPDEMRRLKALEDENCEQACKKGSESILVQSPVHDAAIRRAFRRSILARPYICRLRVFRRLIWPSVWPLDQGSVRAATTAA